MPAPEAVKRMQGEMAKALVVGKTQKTIIKQNQINLKKIVLQELLIKGSPRLYQALLGEPSGVRDGIKVSCMQGMHFNSCTISLETYSLFPKLYIIFFCIFVLRKNLITRQKV